MIDPFNKLRINLCVVLCSLSVTSLSQRYESVIGFKVALNGLENLSCFYKKKSEPLNKLSALKIVIFF